MGQAILARVSDGDCNVLLALLALTPGQLLWAGLHKQTVHMKVTHRRGLELRAKPTTYPLPCMGQVRHSCCQEIMWG